MSNYLAIATVTAVFGRMIGDALDQVPTPSGIPRVRFGPPRPDPQFVGCSLYLYGMSQNALRRNDGRPRTVLDANYLLTFAGDEETLEPQRFLGAVISTVQAQPIVPRDAIKRTIESLDFLQGSDLDQEPDQIRFAQAPLDLALLAELWESFSPAAYGLSITYTAASITIDANAGP